MNKILVSTDFSSCAKNAMQYAFKLAQEIGADIVVLHCIYPNEAVDNNIYNTFFIDANIAERKVTVEKWLKQYTNKATSIGIKISTTIEVSYPVSAICQTAKKINASMIVMGTKGASGLKGVLLGSVASGVLANTKIPVMVVSNGAKYKQYARFALATDFKMSVSVHALQVMREMLYVQRTGLDIIHVLPEEGGKVSKASEDSFSKKLGTVPHNYHYLHDNHVVNAIENFVELNKCNALVLIAHEYGLIKQFYHKSIIKAMAEKAKIPLLILHDA